MTTIFGKCSFRKNTWQPSQPCNTTDTIVFVESGENENIAHTHTHTHTHTETIKIVDRNHFLSFLKHPKILSNTPDKTVCFLIAVVEHENGDQFGHLLQVNPGISPPKNEAYLDPFCTQCITSQIERPQICIKAEGICEWSRWAPVEYGHRNLRSIRELISTHWHFPPIALQNLPAGATDH